MMYDVNRAGLSVLFTRSHMRILLKHLYMYYIWSN